MKLKLASLLGVLLFATIVSAAELKSENYAYQLGTKSYLVVNRGIEVPAETSEPMYITRDVKTGKQKFVSKVQDLSSSCMIVFVNSKLSDILIPGSTISFTKSSAGRDEDMGWVFIKLNYSTPIDSIHCYSQKGLLTIAQLKTLLAPYFELVADSANR